MPEHGYKCVPYTYLALIGQTVSEMFGNICHIRVHVYIPGAGADNPAGSNVFQKT